MHVIIDTREQRPWSFDPSAVCARVGTLKTGDYALDGDDSFAIERKSLDDFLGTIATRWPVFCKEINRMAEWSAKVIIVEGDFKDCCFREAQGGAIIGPYHSHNQLTPQFVMKRIAQLSMRGVSVLFAHNAELATGLATSILRERWLELSE
ncbi:MAG: ERCC4 domain-containing protein [Verrucomicrobiota bacterium]